MSEYDRTASEAGNVKTTWPDESVADRVDPAPASVTLPAADFPAESVTLTVTLTALPYALLVTAVIEALAVSFVTVRARGAETDDAYTLSPL